MILRHFLLLISFLLVSNAIAQGHEEVVIDLFENGTDYGTVIQPFADGYIIGTRDFCESRRCAGIMHLTTDNAVVWYQKRDSFVQQRETLEIIDSFIYYTGFNEFDSKSHIINVLNAYGVSDSIFVVSEPDFQRVTISASQIFGDYHISGSIIETSRDTSKSFAGLLWYDMKRNTLDTVLITSIDNIDVWDMRVSKDSFLLVSYYYNMIDGSNDWHRRIEKYNLDKELVWVWDKGGLTSWDLDHRSNMEVLDNGDIIIVHTNSHPWSSSTALWCLDSDGEPKWKYELDYVPTGSEKIYNIRKTANNDIIGCGARTDVLAKDTRSGLVFRLNQDGELLWKRTYADTLGHLDLVGGELLDIVELTDGSLVATGFKNTRYIDADGETQRDRDLWILHMDENGCLADRCGIDLTTSTSDQQSNTFALYPNPTDGLLCFPSPLSGLITVYSLLGEELYSEKLSYNECIDISNLGTGAYILQYQDEQRRQTLTKKIIKI